MLSSTLAVMDVSDLPPTYLPSSSYTSPILYQTYIKPIQTTPSNKTIHIYTAMFDLTNDPTSLALIQTFAAANKPVAAVCHGPCVLLNAKAPSGVPLISGVGVTGFSNAEEDAVHLSAAMPFMLETELGRVTGGKYVKAAEPWGEMVVVGKAAGTGSTIITGQNPGSATGVGKAILKALGL